MSIPDGKSRRSLTMPDELWALIDSHMLESNQTVSEVMSEVMRQMVRGQPTVMDLRLDALELRLAEQEKMLQQQSERLQYLITLVEPLAIPVAPPVQRGWRLRLIQWSCLFSRSVAP